MVMNNAHDLALNCNVPVGQGVTLEPFLHQVAGRATIMCLNETIVCKPLNYREHFFYKSLPPDILQFTPQFKGIVNVNIEETADGNITLTAYPFEAENDSDKFNLQDFLKSNEETNNEPTSANEVASTRSIAPTPYKRIRLKRTGSLCVDCVVGEEDCSGNLSSTLVNPWIFKVYKEGLKRHLRSSNKAVQKCILLENVASQFRRPCVLDLKMGTRVYGDHDDDDKKLRQKRKCALSTTQKFGFRLSGMQVFDSDSGQFICRDKYFGMKLDAAGLRATLHQFFYDGRKIRRELIVPVVNRLRSIRDILEQLRSYRFYASSLLIMYDGDVDYHYLDAPVSSSGSPRLKSDSDSQQSGSVSYPVGNGESSREESCSSSDRQNNSDSDSSQEQCSLSKSLSTSISDVENLVSNPAEYGVKQDPARSDSPERSNQMHVDIRMIDFAKCTHRDMVGSTVVHDGPDHGYIFGLTNLILILEELMSTEPFFHESLFAKVT